LTSPLNEKHKKACKDLKGKKGHAKHTRRKIKHRKKERRK